RRSITLENSLRDERERDREFVGEGADNGHAHEYAEEIFFFGNIFEYRKEVAFYRAALRFLQMQFLAVNQIQHNDDGNERKCIHKKSERHACSCYQEARYEGPYRAGQISDGRDQGDRVAKVFRSYHFVDEGLPCRVIDRGRKPHEERKDVHHPY